MRRDEADGEAGSAGVAILDAQVEMLSWKWEVKVGIQRAKSGKRCEFEHSFANFGAG